MACYVEGVSTRRVEDVARAMGIDGISKSQVSRICAELDEVVDAWRNRPLDAGPTRCCGSTRWGCGCVRWADLCDRAAGGHRGQRPGPAGDRWAGHRRGRGRAAWTGFLRGLVARGLSGVKLVTSDAHQGLVEAIGAVLDGAAWQRCRTHFRRNLLVKVPRYAQPMVASLVRTIFAQERAEDAWAQLERVVAQLEQGRFGDAAALLADAAGDILAYTAFPKACWRSVWSNNPRSGSTARSAAGLMWSAASLTAPR
jgi:putative transposase